MLAPLQCLALAAPVSNVSNRRRPRFLFLWDTRQEQLMAAMRTAGDHVRLPEVDHGISEHLQEPV